MINLRDVFERLSSPFPPHQVHWRIGPRNRDKTKGQPLAYLNARDVMGRLDDVVGPECWQDHYTEGHSGRVFCHLTIMGVTKGDGAGSTDVEGAKGAISDAFKRAAVKFGIGRYLYYCDAPWIDLDDKGHLPRNFNGDKYLPAPIDKMPEKHAAQIATLLDGVDIESGDGVDAFAEAWLELDQDEQRTFGPWVGTFWPGKVTAAKEKMRDALQIHRATRG